MRGFKKLLFIFLVATFVISSTASIALAETYTLRSLKATSPLADPLTFQLSSNVPTGWYYSLKYSESSAGNWKDYGGAQKVTVSHRFSITPGSGSLIKNAGTYYFRVYVGEQATTEPTNSVSVSLTSSASSATTTTTPTTTTTGCTRNAPLVETVPPNDIRSFKASSDQNSIRVSETYKIKVTNKDTSGCKGSFFKFSFGSISQGKSAGVTLSGDTFTKDKFPEDALEGFVLISPGGSYTVTGTVVARLGVASGTSPTLDKTFNIPIIVERVNVPSSENVPGKVILQIKSLREAECLKSITTAGISSELKPEITLTPETTEAKTQAGQPIAFNIVVKNLNKDCPDDRFFSPIIGIRDISTFRTSGEPETTDGTGRIWTVSFVSNPKIGTASLLSLKTSTSEKLSGASTNVKYFIWEETRTDYQLKNQEPRSHRLIITPPSDEKSPSREVAFCIQSRDHGQVCQTKSVKVLVAGATDTTPPTILSVTTDPGAISPNKPFQIKVKVADDGPMDRLVINLDKNGNNQFGDQNDVSQVKQIKGDGEFSSESIILENKGTYNYKIEAFDAAGKSSSKTGIITVEDAVDLVITSLTVTPRKIASSEQQLQIKAEVQNNGNVKASGVNVRLYIGSKSVSLVPNIGENQEIDPQTSLTQDVGKTFSTQVAIPSDKFEALKGSFSKVIAEAYINLQTKPTELNLFDNTKESDTLEIGDARASTTPTTGTPTAGTPAPVTDFNIKNFATDKAKITGDEKATFSFDVPEVTTGALLLGIRCNIPGKSDVDLGSFTKDNSYSKLFFIPPKTTKYTFVFPDDFRSKDSSGNVAGLDLVKGEYSCKSYVKVGDKEKSSDAIKITSEVERKAEAIPATTPQTPSQTPTPSATVQQKISKLVDIGKGLDSFFGGKVAKKELNNLPDNIVFIQMGTISGAYRIHEELRLTSGISVKNPKTATTPNENLPIAFLEVLPDSVSYNIVFDDSLKSGNLFTDASEENPFLMNLMGDGFRISKATSDSITIDVGLRLGVRVGAALRAPDGTEIKLDSIEGDKATFSVKGEKIVLGKGQTQQIGDTEIKIIKIDVEKVVVVFGTEKTDKRASKIFKDGDGFVYPCGISYSVPGCSSSKPDWVWVLKNLDKPNPEIGAKFNEKIDSVEDKIPTTNPRFDLPKGLIKFGIDSVTLDENKAVVKVLVSISS